MICSRLAGVWRDKERVVICSRLAGVWRDKERAVKHLPAGLVVKTLGSQCRGCGFNPQSGN